MRRALVLLTASLASTSLPAQWGAVSTTGTPAPRSDALLAYDLPNQRMLLFGGNWSNDFYSLQNGVYTALTPATLPGARTRAAIAVDSILGTVVLYGGDGGGSQLALDETWLWNGTDWQLLQTTVSPGGLARHCMAFDVARQETVLFGGRQNSWNSTQAFGDTWVFDGTDWAMATPLNSPPARLNAALAYHPALGGVMLHGGEDPQSGALGDSWWFDGLDWTQLPTTGTQPSPRSKANLVPILGRAVVVLHGGEDPTTLQIQNDTWEHDGSSWRRVDNVYGGIYPARRGAAVAHDFALDRLVAVGGKLANGSLRNDTWEYGAQWQRFGTGCPGSNGRPDLAGGSLPRLGFTCTAAVTNLPPTAGAAIMTVGLSRQQWAFGSLPMLLDPFGMTGCRAYASAEVATAVAAVAGVANWSWAVPSDPAFVGQPFHLQAIVVDPAANAAGATVSNAATMVVGW